MAVWERPTFRTGGGFMLGQRARRPRAAHDELPHASALQREQPRFLAELLLKAEQRTGAALVVGANTGGGGGKAADACCSQQKLHSAVAARLLPVALELEVPAGAWPPKLPKLP
eukprot:5556980-Prymnesium_polylepis.2